MAALKLKVKKALLSRIVNGTKKKGYYGRVITNGTKTVEEILKASCKGSTLDYREGKLALDMIIDGITEYIEQGYIIDLGSVGKLYPAVNGPWKEDPKELSLEDMRGKVNYKAGDDIAAAVRGARLTWTTEEETDDNTVDGDSSEDITPSTSSDASSDSSDTDIEG